MGLKCHPCFMCLSLQGCGEQSSFDPTCDDTYSYEPGVLARGWGESMLVEVKQLVGRCEDFC